MIYLVSRKRYHLSESSGVQEGSVRISTRAFFVYGLVGGAIATITSFVVNLFLGLPSPPEAVFQLLITPVPGSIESVLVETFGEVAKYGTFTFAALIYTLLYGVISVFIRYLFGTKRITNNLHLIALATTIPTAIGLGFQALLASNVIVLKSVSGWWTTSVVMLCANLTYAVIVIDQLNTDIRKIRLTKKAPSKPLGSWSRRGFLRKLVIAAAVVAAAGIASWLGISLFSGHPAFRSNTPIPIDNLSTPVDLSDLPTVFHDPRISDLVGSEITDNRVFYRIDIDPIPPQVDFDRWSLKISGTVNTPLVIDRNRLLAFPVKEEYATLECVSNTIDPPGGLISNAKWSGISIAALLTQVGISPESKFVVFRCADGYSVGIPLERAMDPGALLAYKMNDELLPSEHGFPLRAIVPGIYGMMNAKWITEIEVTDQVYLGYWQERGWSNDAKIKTTSLIYYPAPGAQVSSDTPIAGVAFAGDRGIIKVEVSTDGGGTWNEAVVKKPRSPYSWMLWAYEWTPSDRGNHVIVVRATDGTGQLQDPSTRPNFPDGATGYHSVEVIVV
jgi:DMSO/TMAO reductase YedYZ molybdopterin-dependent catalytic subunit